ncbi:MAG: hypothetical protein M3Y27_09150 [Acidobacteriota bacterium]|nr:hypothetical protein [Acidobacteriota bacterium]
MSPIIGPLDEERDELLMVLTEQDTHPKYRKYIRNLIAERLKQIEERRKELNLPDSDPADYAESEEAERE